MVLRSKSFKTVGVVFIWILIMTPTISRYIILGNYVTIISFIFLTCEIGIIFVPQSVVAN